MTFPVMIEASENGFVATLVGVPDVHVSAPTRGGAIAALKEKIAERIGQGGLISLDVQDQGLAGLAGKYASDPTLADIVAAAYAERDAQRPS